jgi:hypothetical protein
MSYGDVDNDQDVIDTRHIIERIEELESQIDEDAEDNPEKPETAGLTDDEVVELNTLRELLEECELYFEDTHYGVALIRDDYFTEYAKQFADDIGAISDDAKWPCNHIDWDAAAEELQVDYTPVEYDGVTYWGR